MQQEAGNGIADADDPVRRGAADCVREYCQPNVAREPRARRDGDPHGGGAIRSRVDAAGHYRVRPVELHWRAWPDWGVAYAGSRTILALGVSNAHTARQPTPSVLPFWDLPFWVSLVTGSFRAGSGVAAERSGLRPARNQPHGARPLVVAARSFWWCSRLPVDRVDCRRDR